MITNQKISEGLAVLGSYDPASVSPSTVTTGWMSAQNVHQLMALIVTGVLGASATVDAKIQQAVDSSGTSAKDVTGKAITQIVKATGDNVQALLNFRTSDLDVANGFDYVRISITVGTAASIVAAYLMALPRFADASGYNQTAVKQVI